MSAQTERPAGRHPHGPSKVDHCGDRHEDSPEKGAEQRLPVAVSAIPKGDGEVRVTLADFKGALVVDVRLFEPFTMARARSPTKKGIALGLRKLPELARALAPAEAVARQLGLLD